MVGDRDKQRLTAGIFASKRKEADLIGSQIDLAACQAMLPMSRHLEAAAEQMHTVGFIGSAQKDHGAAGLGVQIELEALWIGPSCRRGVTALNAAGAVARGVASRDHFQVQQIEEVVALPHLGLHRALKLSMAFW